MNTPQTGDCHEFAAQFAGNSLSDPGLPGRIRPVFVVCPGFTCKLHRQLLSHASQIRTVETVTL